MSKVTGKDGVVCLCNAVPGAPPVAAILVSDWSLDFTLTRAGAVTMTAPSAGVLRRLLYGPVLRVRSLTQAELAAR